MTSSLSRFKIEGLHSLRTIDVPIRDNRLVLVGENGTGKSTVANFIYYFLSQQWRRMLEYDFERVIAVLNDEEIVLARNEIGRVDPKAFGGFARRGRTSEVFQRLLQHHSLDELLRNPDLLFEAAQALDMPPDLARSLLMRLADDGFSESNELRTIGKKISDAVSDQLLFLPTYRRIEQDLRYIFPSLDTREFANHMRQRTLRGPGVVGYVELVEFGMQDVELMIKKRMETIKDDVRTGLDKLTGTYLRDVIRGDYRSADVLSALQGIDEQTMDAILGRIPQAILSEHELTLLREIIGNFRTTGTIEDHNKVVAHFLIQLDSLYRTQQEKERDVREFVMVCNGYLLGKQIVYDDRTFETSVRQQHTNLEMKALSSGEKQIISLFSHIYFSGQSGYFVVIDEPELSLSVKWQRRFLPDILSTGRCNGLIAVTHSPFIFDNELDGYTHSIEEFVEARDVLSG